MDAAKPKQYRQGDVFLDEISEDAFTTATTREDRVATVVKAERGRLILARGEATGHHHSFGDGEGIELIRVGDELFLKVDAFASLEHQEHDPIEVEAGMYRVSGQREYQPSAPRQEVRVRD